ncbi:LysR family transcriptional regulator [Pelagerythrobacter rhizovicinus]|uniref:LysR family transcriptional regulator n=1 Tax=Pelagerythrobacter rhizovicinus TaxID=2268576 RepID=A0A4Q2KKT0_9SPHN|nr:LysR family transcriptional regulator [Pelagerythrobacter rhizovicinus]RXZ64977.1 LysR family transcriptional regulator [Pelagerythrobacter rhizovicinus]
MDTTWLEDFLALAEHGGFSRAAESRSVSQPSFSRRIKSLEDWVGAPLIDRRTHRIGLTAAGESFRLSAEETLRRLQLGRAAALAADKTDHETLRFASTHVLSLTFFPRWLRRLEVEKPVGATIALTADHMVACERRMIEGKAQFLLCHHHEAAPTRFGADFRSVQLGHDRLLPVAAPSLLKKCDPADAPQLAFTAESGMGRILASAWERENRTRAAQPIFSSHLASVLTAMARDGRGVAWTALSLVQEDLAEGRLERAGSESEDVVIEIRLWRPRARQSPAAEAFWSRILEDRRAAGG